MLKRFLQRFKAQANAAQAASPFVTRYPPGHFYSPLPDPELVKKHRARYFGPPPASLPGIDLREGAQLALAAEIAREHLPKMPVYTKEALEGLRFHHGNNFFSSLDAAMLYGMLQHVRPRRIIEAGSGFSSALMLDTNERDFGRSMELTFIEPYPDRLKKLLLPEDRAVTNILTKPLQDVPLDTFSALEENDILFIDSTHVSKIGSDVNYIMFEILPRLNAGVYIHVHDIFYPFEYLEHWLQEGRAWNEAYLLRAFLTFNEKFEIVIFNAYLKTMHPEVFAAAPWTSLPAGGSWGSIWLRKV